VTFMTVLTIYLRLNSPLLARCLWLMPVILATQEAEIRRIVVQSQPREKVCQTLSQKKPSQKKGWWNGSRYRP
jgi:hypothetical protein